MPGQPAARTHAAMRCAVTDAPGETSSTELPAAMAAIAWPSQARASSSFAPRAIVSPRGWARQVFLSPVGPGSSRSRPSASADW